MNFWRSTHQEYALMAKILHWLSAVWVVALFALGLWMMSLNYYHPWYQKGPELHIGMGLILALVIVFRLIYRLRSGYPPVLSGTPPIVRKVAHLTHMSLYVLLFAMFISGYLIVTAKGDDLLVFGVFKLPAIISGIDNLEDTMGELHEILAFTVIGLASLHAAAALKHHFFDKDDTLRRMLTKGRDSE